MPDEADRITKNKRIELPGGAEVLFPVVARITFDDASDRHQETQHTIDNTEDSDRQVHVAWVGGDQATEDAPEGEDVPGDALAVERIDIWRAVDQSERGQEIFTSLDNKTKAPDGPPYFTTHLKTHVLRIVNDPDDGNWIETEVIDQFSFLDPSDRNQETIYNLENPPGEPDGDGNLLFSASTDDAEMDGDAPWRTDPFQNIVNISGAPYWIVAQVNSVSGFPVFHSSSFGTGTGTPITPPVITGYTTGTVTSIDLSWAPVVALYGNASPPSNPFDPGRGDSVTVTGTGSFGTTTVTGSFASGQFSISADPTHAYQSAGPDAGFGDVLWTPGAPFVFKPGSPGNAQSNDSSSSMYVPPVFGGDNTAWKSGSFSVIARIRGDSLTSGPVFTAGGTPPQQLLASCTATLVNITIPTDGPNPPVIFSQTTDFLVIVITEVLDGVTIDYTPVAAYLSNVGFEVLYLGTPRSATA